jgi:hypothetical protein
MSAPPFFAVGIAGLLSLASPGVPVQPSGAFLDRPFPTDIKLETKWDPPESGTGPGVEYHMLGVASVPQCIGFLQKMSGKQIVLPLPLEAEVREELMTNDQPTRGSSWGVEKDKPIRDIFNRLCLSINVTPSYDPAGDKIVLRMDWQRDDPRTGAELVRFLQTETPVPWEKLLSGPVNLVGGHGWALDPWRMAFDALLSKPENFSSAGFLRVDENEHAWGLGNFPVLNLLSHKMRDRTSGRVETLVLNGQGQMMIKQDPGDIAYYLFDESGKFLKGGIYAMGEGAAGMITKATANSDSQVTIDVGWGFGLHRDHAHFAVENGDFVFKGATGWDGSVMSAAEASSAPKDQISHIQVPPPGGDLTMTLGPKPETPAKPPPAPSPSYHWHGAMGVLKMKVGS